MDKEKTIYNREFRWEESKTNQSTNKMHNIFQLTERDMESNDISNFKCNNEHLRT